MSLAGVGPILQTPFLVAPLGFQSEKHLEASHLAQLGTDLSAARLRLLLDLTRNTASLELHAVLGQAAVGTRRVMASDFALLGLVDLESGLHISASDFSAASKLQQKDMDAIGKALGNRVLTSGEYWCGEADDAAEIAAKCDPQWAAAFQNCCVLPLATARDGILGILAVGRCSGALYSGDEIDFLMQLSNQLATAVERTIAYGDIPEEEADSETDFEGIVGKSANLQRLLRQVKVVAPTGSTVLIQGETGTGKELIAQAIHNLSRPDRPFVKLNCAAIPSGLLESELFGHEKGAFTGALMRKAGRFELADKGTVFLDEVGDIPLELQPKLLRVLQEREFERLGSARTQQVDVRVIAATHRDLKQMVADGLFRSDLYYRLRVFPLIVPPLRDRRDDIPLLVRHYVDKYAQQMNRRIETIPPQTLHALVNYSWPGNVRELQNFIERAVILSPGSVLRAPLAELSQEVPACRSMVATLKKAERDQVLQAIRESNWVIGGPNGAAARLGMKRTTLMYRIRKLRIQLRPESSSAQNASS